LSVKSKELSEREKNRIDLVLRNKKKELVLIQNLPSVVGQKDFDPNKAHATKEITVMMLLIIILLLVSLHLFPMSLGTERRRQRLLFSWRAAVI
jgi:uncharacterized membrane protein